MLAAIALAVISFQKLGPILPPSCSTSFQATALSVEEALQSENFELARKRWSLLPKTTITYTWDDSKVPQNYRAEFRKARDEAFAMWKQKSAQIKFEASPKGELHFSFEPILAIRPDTGYPASHVGFFSEDPNLPRLDFVMGLKRGKPAVGAEVLDVFDDVAYAVGSYFGIADGIYDTYTMGATDLPRVGRTSISGTEFNTLRVNLAAINALDNAIKTKTPLIVAKSRLLLDRNVLEAAPAFQGDRVDLHLQVTNAGTGPLSFSMFPDCGCTIVTDPGVVDPQSTRMLQVAVDTRMFTTNIEKHVTLYTNDPETPVKVVTMKIPLKPRYRFICPTGDTVVVPKGGRKVALYLIPAKKSDIEPVSFKFDGMDASVTVQPFSGVLADPDMHEGPMERKGYKYIFNIKDTIPSGRTFGTLQVLTSNSEFPNLTYTMYAQKGIIALPEDVPLGQIGKVPRTANVIISGPGLNFKVTGAESNSAHLKATYSQLPGSSDYLLTIHYDGLAKPGEILSTIKVKTSSPTQPIVYVSVRAIVQ